MHIMDCENFKLVVLKNLVTITGNTTNIPQLNLHLIQSGVIFPSDKESIESCSTQQDQVSNLMFLLIKKGPGTKKKVVEALRNTGNDHIADIINSNIEIQGENVSKEISDDGNGDFVMEEISGPILDKLQKMVAQELEQRIENILVASKTRNISIDEEELRDGSRRVRIKEVEAPKKGMGVKSIGNIVLIGNEATGKTCMIEVWMTGKFPSQSSPTVFNTYQKILEVNGNMVRLEINDTSGQENYDRIRALSYPESNIFIIVYSVDKPSSLFEVELKWLSEISNFCGTELPIFLVGSRIDLRNDQQTHPELKNEHIISTELGKKVAEKIGAHAFFECSALTGEGMQEIISEVVRILNFKHEKMKTEGLEGCCRCTLA